MSGTTGPIQPAPDDRVVVFIDNTRPEGFKAHSGAGDKLKKSVGELRGDYRDIVAQILGMVRDSEPTTGDTGFKLSEITVGLGFDAKGKLGFIAGIEAGVSASVSVKFARP